MREDYHQRLEHLGAESSVMCTMVGNCLDDAVAALLTKDLTRAEQVIAAEGQLGRARAAAETAAVQLLALQAPVASELRRVVAALWIVADLERMGTLAVHVARTVVRRHPLPAVPDPARSLIERMGALAVDLAEQAGMVLRDQDVRLARMVESADRRIDDLQREMFALVLAASWTDGVESAVDLTLLSRYLERFADHAVAVAKRVVFIVTGDTTTVQTISGTVPQEVWI